MIILFVKIVLRGSMKKYKVIDLQKTDFMGDTWEKPESLNSLRSRFWSLEDARATKYKYFTADYIREVWQVEFEGAK